MLPLTQVLVKFWREEDGGGPGKSYEQAQQTQATVAQGQLDIAKKTQVESEADRERRIALQQPLITKETALAKGDAKEALRAAAPQVGILASGFQAAKDQIFDTVPAGPARDYALANLERGKDTGIATTIGEQVRAAPEILANVGSGIGAFSLQELGASLSGYGGAGTTASNIAGESVSAYQAKMGPYEALIGAAGSAAGGYFSRL